ncbi:MAG: DUF192 domain-containing protein [Deltaproteobacteria bacterium]
MTVLFDLIILFFMLMVPASAENTARVCFQDVCLRAQVADSEASRQKGLMFREKIDPDEAMLFVFQTEGRYGFWMRNVKFPLDIIWISRDKTVTEIKTDVLPCEYDCDVLIPAKEAKYVLEVAAGFVVKNRINIADKVSF